MLRELNHLGIEFELSPLGYSEVIAHWEIQLPTGGIIPLVTTLEGKTKEGKTKPGQSLLLPDLRRNADEPLLVSDAGEYVFGVGDRGSKRQPLYLQLLDLCIANTGDEGCIQVRNFINSAEVEELERCFRERMPLQTKQEYDKFSWERDRIIFTLNGEIVTDRPAVQQFWSKYYASKQDVEEGTCLLTGEKTLTVGRKMPMMIKGVPGSASSGAALTSFDKAAYQSFGWEGNTNAPIGFEAAVRLHKMLDVLLRSPHHHERIGGQVFVFWGAQNGEGIDRKVWEDPAAAVAKSIFTSRDQPSILPDDSEISVFFLATLKGNRGRVALSSWDEQTRETISESVTRFVECQQFAKNLRAKPIWRLRNCAFREPNKEYTDKIDTALVRAVLCGASLPDEYAIRVINRICLEQDVFHSKERAQALAFYLESNSRGILQHLQSKNNDRDRSFAVTNTKIMDNVPTLPSQDDHLKRQKVAYILGRIAFLMHWAQYVAQHSQLGKTDKEQTEEETKKLPREDTNVSRSLRALSTTPVQVFPKVFHGCITHHLEARDGDKQLGYIKRCINQEFTKFGDGFDPSVDLPETFNVKEQSCFFMGWGIRRSEFFTTKEKEKKND